MCASCIETNRGLLLHSGDLVLCVHKRHLRRIRRALFIAHRRVSANDQQVAQLRQAGRRAIQRNFTAAALAGNRIRGKPLTVIDVVEFDFFVDPNIDCFQQVDIDAAGTLVIQHAFSNGDAMQLGAKHDSLHGNSYVRSTLPSAQSNVADTISSSRLMATLPSLSMISFRKSSTLREYSADASAATSAARFGSPMICTPYLVTVLPSSDNGQLPPCSTAISTITEPGFI